MKTQLKTTTWGILNVLLASLLMTHCEACKDKGGKQNELLVKQQKLIEEFKTKYVEPGSDRAFDEKITEIKGQSVEDIGKYIAELEDYKKVAENEKQVESTTDNAERQGYIQKAINFIKTSGNAAIQKFASIYQSVSGSKSTKDQTIDLIKQKLLDVYKFKAKLDTVDKVVGCLGDMIDILENIRQAKN
jgi:DNA polymerase III delta prime subunit